MEDPRKRAAEGRKLRIDHSDVYFENERLSEKLDTDLDNLSRLRHRQWINRHNEISELRKTLTMNGKKSNSAKTPPSSANSIRPHTSPVYRRRPPPTVVKLNVRIPDKDHNADANSNSSNSDNDTDSSDSSDDDGRRRRRRRGRGRGRGLGRGNGGEDRRGSALSSNSSHSAGTARGGPGKMVPKRTTLQDVLLGRLGMKEVPKDWSTKVLQPTDVFVRPNRAASARPSTSFGHHPSSTQPSPGRRKAGEESGPVRRAKSAMPFLRGREDEDERCRSTLFCGGEQQCQKTGTMSRRQLMELAGQGKGSQNETDLYTPFQHIREAARIERERLEARVKLFISSCDQVAEGGISSRKSKRFQTLVTPHVMY